MKKIIIGLLFVVNVVILSSCQVDRCPEHGERAVPQQHQPLRA
jgi:hypothetical protein